MTVNHTIDSYTIGAKDYHNKRQQSWVGRGNLDEYIKDAKSILDFGCGPGIMIPELIRLNFSGKYVGYDPSEGMVDEAVSSYQSPASSFQIEFSTDLINALSEKKFDTFFSIAVFHHLTLSEINELLENLKIYLIENAKIVITLWEIGKSQRHRKFRVGQSNRYLVPLLDSTGKEVGKREYFDYSKEEIVEVFKLSGFRFVVEKIISGENFSNILFEFSYKK